MTSTPTTGHRASHLPRRLAAVGGVGALLTLASAAPASAHERWFAEHAAGGDWAFFFTNPQLARNTLAEYPQLDVFALVGLPVPTDVFIVVAGAVELLFGLLVLSGAMPQVAVLVAMVPFNATLFLFGTTEVIGHLPVYGVFLTLLVLGSDPRTAAEVSWLPSRRDLVDTGRRMAGLGGRRAPAPAAG